MWSRGTAYILEEYCKFLKHIYYQNWRGGYKYAASSPSCSPPSLSQLSQSSHWNIKFQNLSTSYHVQQPHFLQKTTVNHSTWIRADACLSKQLYDAIMCCVWKLRIEVWESSSLPSLPSPLHNRAYLACSSFFQETEMVRPMWSRSLSRTIKIPVSISMQEMDTLSRHVSSTSCTSAVISKPFPSVLPSFSLHSKIFGPPKYLSEFSKNKGSRAMLS